MSKKITITEKVKNKLSCMLQLKRRRLSGAELSLQQIQQADIADVATLFDHELLKTQAPDDFLSNERFPWIANIEANTAGIEQETANLLRAIDLVPPFGDVQESQRTLSGSKWRIFPFLVYGHRVDWSHEAFPATSEVISKIPECITAMFSILQPGQHLHPHIGPNSAVLRYHLPTYVPEPDKCAIRVADQTRHWEQSKSLVLNDYREHEAWNRGEKARVVLFVDFKRPVPTELEPHRDAVIERYSADNFSHEIFDNFNIWVDSYGEQILGKVNQGSATAAIRDSGTLTKEGQTFESA